MSSRNFNEAVKYLQDHKCTEQLADDEFMGLLQEYLEETTTKYVFDDNDNIFCKNNRDHQ